ncbi:hypothetical protein [Bacteroides thetaiotaomicron]|nr:hypothetical protein [Bacteroides thetaiotaomicron]MCS3074319.1 hypothetical protein [Bacteroides thetaiotaomicron]MCS3172963.1 hypothetical protein [Bacteroides thetaiotaomicron]MDC2112376.1 hypothetical protein [Bacteroides thetaiotaomicron]MDT4420725.1 hypothetical protein [Bacteroides thetaiotaomicron]UVP27351.1 hypothetical protein NXW22_15050 [Bacteroides thetaiotaomicron]
MNEGLADKVKRGTKMVIVGGTEQIDEEYAKEYQLLLDLANKEIE